MLSVSSALEEDPLEEPTCFQTAYRLPSAAQIVTRDPAVVRPRPIRTPPRVRTPRNAIRSTQELDSPERGAGLPGRGSCGILDMMFTTGPG